MKYAHGYIRQTPYGTWRAERNHAYRTYRATHNTLDDARNWLDLLEIQLTREQRTLAPLEQRDAIHALNLLPEHVSLTDAARHYLATHSHAPAPTLREAIRQFLNEKEHLDLRPKSLQILHTALRRLQTEFPSATLDQITTTALSNYLTTQRFHGATWNNHRRDLRNFFTWCQQRQYLDHNPAAALPRAQTDQTLPGILTVPQCRTLLDTGRATPLIPYIALALFAGVRPDELLRLHWTAIQPEHIHIGPQAAKIRRQRYIDIAPNLRLWLDLTPFQTGPIVPLTAMTFRRTWHTLRVDAGLFEHWPHDALRHSFATYHLALHQNAPLTAHQLGHPDPETLYRHYRNLATHADATHYWSLIP